MSITIDDKLIKKYLPHITDSDIMACNVRTVLTWEKEAKRLYREEVFVENLADRENFVKLFYLYDLFCDLFGSEYVDKYLLRYTKREIAEEKHYIKTNKYRPEKGIYLRDEKKDIVIPPARTKTTRTQCEIWLIPSQYQGLRHGEIVRKIFAEKYPWIEDYDTKFYELRGNSDEFYVYSEGKSILYVPYKAFVTGDVNSIVKKSSNLKDFDIYNPIIIKFFERVRENAKPEDTGNVESSNENN